MKRFCIAIGLALVFSLFAFTGCAVKNSAGDGEALAPAGSESDSGDDSVHEERAPQEEDDIPQEGLAPTVSPLALLDAVNVSAAFGDRSAEGWSFALKAEGDLSTSYGFRLTSEISDEEKLNLECGLGIGLDDLFGIHSGENNTSGVGLFGGGAASLSLNYRGPAEDSEPICKNFDIDFRHDGDLIWYAGKGENETQTSLSEVKEKIDVVLRTETFKGMENAFLTIPEELQKGVSLRLAVEKLIDLGFTAEIDDSDGIAVSLKANAGFYTDLLNDMLEEFIPAKWLAYLPRADFGYERTVFNIRLSFDENGIFQEYSMSSDISLTASLRVRKLFFSESTVKAGGGFSIRAFDGEVPEGR